MSAIFPAHVAFIEGVELDLRRDHADVFGTVWHWSGVRDAAGQPLMQSLDEPNYPGGRTFPTGEQMPLSDLYRHYGPLIPLPTEHVDPELYRNAWTREAV